MCSTIADRSSTAVSPNDRPDTGAGHGEQQVRASGPAGLQLARIADRHDLLPQRCQRHRNQLEVIQRQGDADKRQLKATPVTTCPMVSQRTATSNQITLPTKDADPAPGRCTAMMSLPPPISKIYVTSARRASAAASAPEAAGRQVIRAIQSS